MSELAERFRALAEELDVAARVIAVEADQLPEGLRRSAMVGRILGMKSAAQRMRSLLGGRAAMTDSADLQTAWAIAGEIDDPMGGAAAVLAAQIAAALAAARAEGYDRAIADREANE